MISFEESFETVLNKAEILGEQIVPVSDSIGYVLAEDLVSEFDIPPFNKSAMDGYAVMANDVESIPALLKFTGEISAGAFYRHKLKRGECVKIMTGAPVPENADTVVMIEDTAERKNSRIEFPKPVTKGSNICYKGEEVKTGTVVLGKGTRMRGPEVCVAASLGKSKIKVFKKPKICIISTGNELLEQNENYESGKIYNSNGPMISALLSHMNVTNNYLGIATDDEHDLTQKIEKGLAADILVLSGGVSVGDYDLVPEVLKRCGVETVFHKIAVKPGKPAFFGFKDKTLVFGLPGNPVAVFLHFHISVKPAIEKIMGMKPQLTWETGTMIEDYTNKPGRKNFIPAFSKKTLETTEVFPVKSYHGSGHIAALTKANSFMILEKDVTYVKKNTHVNILIWDSQFT